MHEHPTQALLDAYTLQRRLGSLEGRHVVLVGDLTHSRVFRSNVLCLTKLGARVTVVAPPDADAQRDRRVVRGGRASRRRTTWTRCCRTPTR